MGKRTYKFDPDYGVPPGETIKECIDHLKMSQSDLARSLGCTRQHVSLLIKGKVPITTRLAIRLEEALAHVPGPKAEFWLAREQEYRLRVHRQMQAEIKEKADG